MSKRGEVMKRLLIICLIIICSIYIFANNTPERPKNIPDDTNYSFNYWEYRGKDENSNSIEVRWHINGNIYHLDYNSEDNKFNITEYYYNNGKLKKNIKKLRRLF